MSLEEMLDKAHLSGYWQSRKLWPALDPHVWRWHEIIECLETAAEEVKLGEDTARRTLQLTNPAIAEMRTASRTMHMAVQMVKPGEIAECHRHTAAAIRFMVQGTAAATVVEGKEMRMEPGDLVLTPNWTWHHHLNDGTEPVIWVDGLDITLARYFDAMFQEEWGEGVPAVASNDGESRRRFGGPVRRRTAVTGIQPRPYTYKWADTYKALRDAERAGEHDPYDGMLLEYTNPLTGGPTMPTIHCQIQLLRPEEETQLHRHTSTTIYHVVQDHGVTVISDRDPSELDWGERDCFVIPPWRWHRFVNRASHEAILFSMTDQPVVEALGFWRVEEKGD